MLNKPKAQGLPDTSPGSQQLIATGRSTTPEGSPESSCIPHEQLAMLVPGARLEPERARETRAVL
eukprot:8067972-Pyramimonas_sp.AAC.1